MQWKTPELPRPKKACMSKSKIKVMLIAFFNQKGMVHHKFVPEDEIVNQHFYQQVLICLHNQVRCSRWELWSDKSWLFYHDTAPAHKAISVRQLLIKTQITALDHLPISQISRPGEFWLFSRPKAVMKKTHFSSLQGADKVLGQH